MQALILSVFVERNKNARFDGNYKRNDFDWRSRGDSRNLVGKRGFGLKKNLR